MANPHSTTTRINQECLIKIYKKFKLNPKKIFIPSEFVNYGVTLKMVKIYMRTLFRMGLIEKTKLISGHICNNNSWRLKNENN